MPEYGKMLPLTAMHDNGDVSSGHAVFNGECLAGDGGFSRATTNLHNVLGSEFRVIPSDTRLGSVPTFSGHVAHVVGMGSQEEMGGVHAGRVIAPVENPQPIAWSIVEFPGEGVCLEMSGVGAIPEDTVTTGCRCGPNPAGSEIGANDRAVFVDLFPEAICNGPFSPEDGAFMLAELPGCADPVVEGGATLETYRGGMTLGLKLATTPFSDRLLLHDESPSRCATPLVARHYAGAFF